jgi:hypothetical protein
MITSGESVQNCHSNRDEQFSLNDTFDTFRFTIRISNERTEHCRSESDLTHIRVLRTCLHQLQEDSVEGTRTGSTERERVRDRVTTSVSYRYYLVAQTDSFYVTLAY